MNPFRQTIVANPWEVTPGDVPEIHAFVFQQCLAGIEGVRERKRSSSLLIHGEAGSGKTHLLSRLRSRLTPTAPSVSHRPEYLFTWVRLQTSPRMIWRTLRRTLVDDWLRPVAGGYSQFQRILFHRLAEIRVAEGDLERWYEYMLAEDPDGLDELMDQIADHLDLDRNTAVAFKHLAFSRHQRDLRAWLSGTSLPELALTRLDLVQDEGSDEDREDDARLVVLSLCRLAGPGLPILLSFDQVEALQTGPDDADALFAFGQLVSTLHDSTKNLLIVSCVQSAFAAVLKDRAREADYDRLTSLGALSLDPLNREQAELLIQRRLIAAGENSASGEARSSCWPLESLEFEDLFSKGFVSPRRLVSLCAERFEARSQGIAADSIATGPDPIEDFLKERWEACLTQKLAENIPDRTEEIVRHGLPLLSRLLSLNLKTVRDEHLPDVPLVFESLKGRRTGLAVCTQSNMTSLAARLRRLKSQLSSQRLARLVIVRDDRVPLSPNARVARQHLEDLEQQRADVVHPTIESLASLDALREIVSDAKAGDLACHGEAITPAVVESWLSRQVAGDLREFAATTFGPSEW